MANQPVKKKFDYEKKFSFELRGLLSHITSDVAGEIPFASLTFDIFLISALDYKDSMLYKSINSFMTSASIEEMYEKLYALVTDKYLAPIRPGRTIEYSPELKNLFVISNDIREEYKVAGVTSDIVLLAFIRTAPDTHPIKKILAEYGLDVETMQSLVGKIHEAVTAIASLNPDKVDEWKNKILEQLTGMTGPDENSVDIYVGMDTGSGDDRTGITIMGTGASSLKEVLETLTGGQIETPSARQPRRKDRNEIEFCTNLNKQAEMGELDTLIGRQKEIFEIAKVLSRKICNNVILVGEPGVGKTVIVNGIAKKIVEGSAPLSLSECEVFKLDINEMGGGTQFRGQFEQRVYNLIKALRKAKNPILFIDNVHTVTNGWKSSEFDIFGELEPIFSDKDVMVIMATTPKGFHSSFDGNPDVSRRFQKITVDAPDDKECLEILEGIIGDFEHFHKVKYEESVLQSAITLAKRYVTDRRLPSSAIDLIDEAGALRKIESSESERTYAKRNKIALLKKKKDELIKADKVGAETLDIDFEIDGLKIEVSKEMDAARQSEPPSITENDLCRAVSEHTGIPVQKINISEKKQLSKIDEILKASIIGQDEAIEIVSRGIKRNKVGLIQTNRPILSCMCIGNTGCGKTLLAKMLAKEIFGDEKYLVRFDMSEYSDKTAVNKLIGASAGYVGYNEGGLLTEAIKNKRHAVLLIDEIEKATDEIYNIFLQILDEGFLTDNTGYKVDFKNTILILTSNVGAKDAANEKAIGFLKDDNSNKKDIIEKELKNKFPPEFLNRLDEIVYFNPLSDENLREIVKLELNKLSDKINSINCSMKYSDDVVDFIFKKIEGEKEYGARPIGRAIQREIENRITDYIIENDCDGKEFTISAHEGEIVIA